MKKRNRKTKIALTMSFIFNVIMAATAVSLYIQTQKYSRKVASLEFDVSELTKYLASTGNRFEFYYIKPAPKQQFGVNKLKDVISRLTWDRPYKENVFDCSEMSAKLEWLLENLGWHTAIVVGDNPTSNVTAGHSWVLVEVEPGAWLPVETLNFKVIPESDENYSKYMTAHEYFETIQEAVAFNESEFDWWK